jgi:hypothetical protein
MTTITNLSDFQALDPFFRIIEEALAGLTDGVHFFDLLAEDVEFDYIITCRTIHGTLSVARQWPSSTAHTDKHSR